MPSMYWLKSLNYYCRLSIWLCLWLDQVEISTDWFQSSSVGMNCAVSYHGVIFLAYFFIFIFWFPLLPATKWKNKCDWAIFGEGRKKFRFVSFSWRVHYVLVSDWQIELLAFFLSRTRNSWKLLRCSWSICKKKCFRFWSSWWPLQAQTRWCTYAIEGGCKLSWFVVFVCIYRKPSPIQLITSRNSLSKSTWNVLKFKYN